MNKLFLHHRYVDIPPRDVSGNDNDGVGHDLTVGAGSLGGSAWFNGSTSWIGVPASASMEDLGQLLGRVVFLVDPAAAAHRLNLVEGFLSFAIVINVDRSVSFTIVDRNGNWRGCTSAPGVVTPGVWHTLIAAHDGVSEARLGLDTTVVARSNDVFGPVRSVENLGIAVGRWPDAPSYQFHGALSEVALYKFDPVPEINFVFGAPCVDPKIVDELLGRMVERMGKDSISKWARAIQDILLQFAQAIQARETDTDEYRKRINSTVIALGNRDQRAFRDAFDPYMKRALNVVREEQYASLRARFVELTKQMPLNEEERLKLAHALCMDRLVPDGDGGKKQNGGQHVR